MFEMQLDRFYDALNTAIFLPWGGSRRIRRALVDSLEVSSRDRVVELGCGTGQVTELLVATGAEVVAVDQLPAMLVGAQRRAPQARIIEGDAMSAEVGGDFDRVVLAFVLHNFDGGGRVDLLRRSRSLLAEEGWVGVLEWGLPNGRWRSTAWRWFLHRLEPSPSVGEILDGALMADIAESGLRVVNGRRVAGGRARVLVLEHA